MTQAEQSQGPEEAKVKVKGAHVTGLAIEGHQEGWSAERGRL